MCVGVYGSSESLDYDGVNWEFLQLSTRRQLLVVDEWNYTDWGDHRYIEVNSF